MGPLLPLPLLEERLSSLAARIAAAECEFLVMLAEFDARGGWGGPGMRSAAHWLSWRCGLRLGAARERVRVARALTLLPVVRARFAAGGLSYCKVRALTRVATPATEADLVELAEGATGAQLEEITRAWRATLVGETAAARHLRRGFWRREQTDGSVVFTLRVAPEEAARVDAAVAAARALLLGEHEDTGTEASDSPAGEKRPSAGQDELTETPEETRLAAEITTDPPAVRAGADAVVLMATRSLLADREATRAAEPFQVVVHADLAQLTRGADSDGNDVPDVPDSPTAQAPAPFPMRARATLRPAGWVADGPALAPATLRRLLCEATQRLLVTASDGHLLDLGRSVRHATRRQRIALAVRDQTCRFPGCTRHDRLIPHHVRWWSRGGSTDLDNLVLLCPAHHHAVHEVGYSVRALGRGRFRFARPDGTSVPDAPLLDTAGAEPSPASAARGLEPVPDQAALISKWGGDPLDLDLLVHTMAANSLNRAGHHLPTLADRDWPAALRAAVAWPLVHPATSWEAPFAGAAPPTTTSPAAA